MRLTIAFDDISLPAAADARARHPAADHRGGADDGGRRRRRRRQDHRGQRAAPPDDAGRAASTSSASGSSARSTRRADLYNHDAEDRDNLLHIGLTDKGEDVEINRRAAESDLLVYVNVNLVAMDGGHKSVPIGLASYKSLRHHHNAKTMVRSHSFMDHTKSHLHHSAWRMGRLLKEHLNIFQIETTLNNDVFPAPYDFLMKREWEWSVKDQASMLGDAPRARAWRRSGLRHKMFHDLRAPYGLTGINAGDTEAVHERTIADGAPPAARRGAGPDRRAGDGGALPRPLQRQLDDEPDPRDLHGAGLLLQLLPRPAGRTPRRGGDPLPPARARASTSCTTRATSTSTRRSSPSRPTRR